MTWFMAGSTALSGVTSIISGRSQAKAAAKQASQQNTAMGEQVTKERLNTTIRNAYSTAFAQMQLGLKKKQATQQAAEISAAGLAAKGNANLAAASTGSIGASTAAVSTDIEMKTQAAIDMTTDAFENTVENYNSNLNMMVLNTDQSKPTVAAATYGGPSMGQIVGGAAISAVGSFAMDYASRKMSLGLGKAPAAESNVSSTINNMNLGYTPRTPLGNTSSFFNTRF